MKAEFRNSIKFQPASLHWCVHQTPRLWMQQDRRCGAQGFYHKFWTHGSMDLHCRQGLHDQIQNRNRLPRFTHDQEVILPLRTSASQCKEWTDSCQSCSNILTVLGYTIWIVLFNHLVEYDDLTFKHCRPRPRSFYIRPNHICRNDLCYTKALFTRERKRFYSSLLSNFFLFTQ